MAIRGLVLAALLACTLAWRLPSSPPEWHFTLCENDSLYQLYRVEQCLHNFPRVQSIDLYSHFPRGYRVHWMPLHTLFYASLARLAGVPAEARESLVDVVSWVPTLLALVALLLVLDIALFLTRNSLCVLVIGVLYAFNGDAIRPFVHGTIDHHLFAHLGVLLMAWGRLRLSLWPWIAGAIALLAMTPEAIIYVTALLGCLFAALLAERVIDGKDNTNGDASLAAWLLGPAAVSAAVFVAGRALETEPLPLLDLTWMYPTAFTPLWLAVLGGSMLAALRGLGSHTIGRGALAAGAVATACALYLYSTGALLSIVTRLVGGSDRFLVGEEAAVFAHGFFSAPAGYRMIAFSSVWVIYRLYAAVRRDTRLFPPHPGTYLFGWLLLALSLVLGFAEYRHLYVLASLQVVALGLAVFGIEETLRSMPLFARARLLPAMLLAAGTLPFFLREDVAGRAAASSAVCAAQPLREELAGWLVRHTPLPGDPPTYGVFTPWSIGHHVHVLANRAVVVDPFNYELDDWVGSAVRRVFHARSSAELNTALRGFGARYFVVINPAAEILDSLAGSGVQRVDLVERTADGRVSYKPAMAQFAAFRLFMTAGASDDFGALRLRYATSSGERYTSNGTGGEPREVFVPDGQIYELVSDRSEPE